MESTRIGDKVGVHAEQVLQMLAAHRLAASPENYRIWYMHLAGDDPALSRAIRTLIENNEPIDEARCAELYERFLVRAAEERTLLRAGQRLSDLAGELTLEVSSFCGETARYGTSLKDVRAHVDAGPTAERLTAITRGMLDETGRMQAHVDQVEAHLRASMAEIEGLRRDLQAAWSEARTDGLTGLANRRHFDQALRATAAQAIEHGAPACVVIADIDHFKQFNDTHGHAFGDQVLKLVAGLLRHNVKGQDLVARYGGEEFALILPATRLADAFALVDRLRDLVSCRQIKLKDRAQSLGRVTMSLGVAQFHPGEPCAEWVARADAALYQAKREGRNRVVALAPADGPPGADPGRAEPATAAA